MSERPLARWEPPIVAVRHPTVEGWDPRSEPVLMTELLQVWCSDCGDVTDLESTDDATRQRLIQLAVRHADEEHEGLVDAVGWVR